MADFVGYTISFDGGPKLSCSRLDGVRSSVLCFVAEGGTVFEEERV